MTVDCWFGIGLAEVGYWFIIGWVLVGLLFCSSWANGLDLSSSVCPGLHPTVERAAGSELGI